MFDKDVNLIANLKDLQFQKLVLLYIHFIKVLFKMLFPNSYLSYNSSFLSHVKY